MKTITKEMLREAVINVTKKFLKESKETDALLDAAADGDLHSFERYVKMGAAHKDEDKFSALEVATKKKRIEILKYMFDEMDLELSSQQKTKLKNLAKETKDINLIGLLSKKL